jgi:glycosyltransferase involved in cell wall biosynthesis
MKESVGKVLMLVENHFPKDTRVRNEAFTLAAHGFHVSVISLGEPGDAFRETVNGVKVYRLPRLTVFSKLPKTGRSKIRQVADKLLNVFGYLAEYVYFSGGCLGLSIYVLFAEGFDVVHAHNPPDTLFIVGGFYKVFGKKFVFDHHDLSPELYQSRYEATNGFVSAVLALCEKLSLKTANVIIATNESYRAIDITRGGVDPESVFIVRNGPDLRRFKIADPDRALKSRAKTILGYVGAMNPQDGVDYCLRALSHLVHDLGRTDFYCVLIGDGDSKEGLVKLAHDLGLDGYAWFTGYISDTDLQRYLSTADICLDPNPSSPLNDVSTWIKVMEYMALGKPVVSFDLKETRRSAGDAAVYVTPNDELKFAQAVAGLMDAPAKRHSMGELGKARVATELGWHVTSKNLIRAYAKLFPEAAEALLAERFDDSVPVERVPTLQ